MKQININVTPAGNATIDAIGFEGCGCTEATEQIELVLGGGQKKQDKKPEYHMPTSQGVSNKLTF